MWYKNGRGEGRSPSTSRIEPYTLLLLRSHLTNIRYAGRISSCSSSRCDSEIQARYNVRRLVMHLIAASLIV